MDSFLADYQAKNAHLQAVKHPAWPADRLFAKEEVELFERAFLIYANSRVSKFCERCFPPAALLDVFSKPQKSVVVKASCHVWSCVLSPDSVKLNSCKSGEESNESFDQRCKVSRGKSALLDTVFFLAPLVEDKRIGALWFVEPTDDRALANMVWGNAAFGGTSGVALQYQKAKFSSRIAGKTAPDENPAQTPDSVLEDAHEEIAYIPVLVNKVALIPGDVLRYLRYQKREKRASFPTPISIEQAMKSASSKRAKK